MKIFLGIGMGPIQTGIFLAGAAAGRFDRIVVAEVDEKLKNAVNRHGKITVNIAKDDSVYQQQIDNITLYSPLIETERGKLIEAASQADEIATALPSVKFFDPTARWLREGFSLSAARRRFVYCAENDNHAAEALHKAVNKDFPATYYLNTVVGKMSGVVDAAECAREKLAELCRGAGRGHLVEEFNSIYISSAPGIEQRQVAGLHVKEDLLPFEEAKLYGHNAIHFLLGILGRREGLNFMNQLRGKQELMRLAHDAFINESGAALCKKYKGFDELFSESGFKTYAEDLLTRMTNPFLKDATGRITRDLPRKLSWNDRSVGAMRLVLAQGFEPKILAHGACLALAELAGGSSPEDLRRCARELWGGVWGSEHEKVFSCIQTAAK